MIGWGLVAPDIVLVTLYTYLLIRLATSSDRYFKKPFYTFFKSTGVYSITSVVSFIFIEQFSYSEKYWTVYIYKIAFAANVFGASGATFGKAFIAIHRYFVMRNRDFTETNWSRSSVLRMLVAQFAFSVLLTAPVWPASYVYQDDVILALASLNTLILKATSICIYVVYVICNVITTVLTSLEFMKLRRAQRGNSELGRFMVHEIRIFIIVTVCSISHLIKALHQFAIAVSTYFNLPELFQIMFNTYSLVNGFATYAAPVCLILFSPKVRSRLLFTIRCYQFSSVSSR